MQYFSFKIYGHEGQYKKVVAYFKAKTSIRQGTKQVGQCSYYASYRNFNYPACMQRAKFLTVGILQIYLKEGEVNSYWHFLLTVHLPQNCVLKYLFWFSNLLQSGRQFDPNQTWIKISHLNLFLIGSRAVFQYARVIVPYIDIFPVAQRSGIWTVQIWFHRRSNSKLNLTTYCIYFFN